MINDFTAVCLVYNGNMSDKKSRLICFFLIGVFIFALVARIIPGPRTIDDSFITFRYSRNILAGNGFVYNQGEHILGTTTPLYTLLLSFIAFFTGNINAPFPWIALVINAFADAATCILLFQICKRYRFPFAGISLSMVWAIAPYSVTFAIGGLETSIYVLLLVSVLYCVIHNQFFLAALFAALSLLTRPDALIFIGLLFISRLYSFLSTSPKNYSSLLKEFGIFLISVLPWVIFSSYYFGSPIPHSILAKSVTYLLPANAALIRLLQHYATPFFENLTFGTLGIGLGFVLYPFLSLVGVLHFWKNDRRISYLMIYPFLYFGAFAIANPLIFRWYLTPPLPFYFMLILIGAEKLFRSIFEKIEHMLSDRKPVTMFNSILIPVLMIFPPFFLSCRNWVLTPDHGTNSPAPGMAYIELELLYKKAADRIIPEIQTTPNATLAAGDVGVLGFFTGLRILDTVGLNSSQALNYYPLDRQYYVINYAIPPDLIMDYKPDYVVILEVYGRLGLLKDDRFQKQYKLLEKIPTDMYGSDGMLIFAKK